MPSAPTTMSYDSFGRQCSIACRVVTPILSSRWIAPNSQMTSASNSLVPRTRLTILWLSRARMLASLIMTSFTWWAMSSTTIACSMSIISVWAIVAQPVSPPLRCIAMLPSRSSTRSSLSIRICLSLASWPSVAISASNIIRRCPWAISWLIYRKPRSAGKVGNVLVCLRMLNTI